MKKSVIIIKAILAVAGIGLGGMTTSMMDKLFKDKKLKAMNEELERLHELAKLEMEARGEMSSTTECRICELTNELRWI